MAGSPRVRKCAKQNSVGSKVTLNSREYMSDQRDDDNGLVEIDAALELLRQMKEDTVKMIVSLHRQRDGSTRKSGRNRKRQSPAKH